MTASERGKIIRFPGLPGTRGALQVRVELLLRPRPVWRRLLVGERASFWDLHVAIQDAFGWEDRHLHQFDVDDPATGGRLRFGIPDDAGFHGAAAVLAGWEHRPVQYLRCGAPPALYVYDFGAQWQHAVELEAVTRDEDPCTLPRCLDGVGQAPAEDADPGAVVQAADFAPDAVRFSDPRVRWQEQFGHE